MDNQRLEKRNKMFPGSVWHPIGKREYYKMLYLGSAINGGGVPDQSTVFYHQIYDNETRMPSWTTESYWLDNYEFVGISYYELIRWFWVMLKWGLTKRWYK